MSELIILPTYSDNRGHLTVLENILPFQIKRLYWIYGAQGNSRGGHRHKLTEQAVICMHGSVEINIHRYQEKQCIKLESPTQCLLLPPEDWHTLDSFSADSVVLVLASHEYDAQDYISTPL